MTKIMFVCTGNICRSPLAHRLFEKVVHEEGKDHLFEVESSGTGAWHVGNDVDKRMRETAKDFGLDLHHPARHLSIRDFYDYYYFIGMDAGHIATMTSMKPPESSSTILLFRSFDPEGIGDVPDPYYGGLLGFKSVFEMIERTCHHLLRFLLDDLKSD